MPNKVVILTVAAAALLFGSNNYGVKEAKAAEVKDTAYCRAAGVWASEEANRRIKNKERRKLDAIEEFGPIQLEEKSYYTFLIDSIYKVEIADPIEGMDELNEKINGTFTDFAKNLAEDVCVSEFLS